MGKMEELMRWARARPGKPEAAAEAPETPEPDPSEKTVDARTKAERKAEEAGARWREAAEARGEIRKEIGGPKGLEPTRYGDWEKAGRCSDF